MLIKISCLGNLCLYTLFEFKPEIFLKDEEVDEEIIMNDFIENLHSYHLFTLQSSLTSS
jgi:hypothetical protein